MDYTNYIKINIDNLKDNIRYLKDTYKYDYYIMDVSNNAYGHGMYLVNSLLNVVDYFYTLNFNDVLLIRKYNKKIPVIYNGYINENNFYDLVMNDAIIGIYSLDELKNIISFKIKDKIEIIFNIDAKGYRGICSRQDILDAIDLTRDTNIEILGFKGNCNENDYEEFKYIINPFKDLKIRMLNSEDDKNKIKTSNAIKLDYSIYGVNHFKKKLFKKEKQELKQVLTFYSKVDKIKVGHKKDKYIAIVPVGYLNGLMDTIDKVYINGKLYKINTIKDEYSVVEIDENVKTNDIVEITSANNPLQNYINGNLLFYFNLFSCNLPILYEDYTLEKTFIY